MSTLYGRKGGARSLLRRAGTERTRGSGARAGGASGRRRPALRAEGTRRVQLVREGGTRRAGRARVVMTLALLALLAGRMGEAGAGAPRAARARGTTGLGTGGRAMRAGRGRRRQLPGGRRMRQEAWTLGRGRGRRALEAPRGPAESDGSLPRRGGRFARRLCQMLSTTPRVVACRAPPPRTRRPQRPRGARCGRLLLPLPPPSLSY